MTNNNNLNTMTEEIVEVMDGVESSKPLMAFKGGVKAASDALTDAQFAEGITRESAGRMSNMCSFGTGE